MLSFLFFIFNTLFIIFNSLFDIFNPFGILYYESTTPEMIPELKYKGGHIYGKEESLRRYQD